jgi:hypothetical protein
LHSSSRREPHALAAAFVANCLVLLALGER